MEEEANIALIESWDNTQAMMDADSQMAQQLQAEEQEQLGIEEKSKLFLEQEVAKKKKIDDDQEEAEIKKLIKVVPDEEKVAIDAIPLGTKPPCILKGLKFKVIKDMFDKAFKRVNTYVDYKTELVKGSEKRAEDSTKRAGTKLEQEVAKKQKIDNDQEEAEMKKLIKVVPDEEEVAIDA
ncbi:hypothetical protein Tco_0786362, partial [Tanacetum coccineum]